MDYRENYKEEIFLFSKNTSTSLAFEFTKTYFDSDFF